LLLKALNCVIEWNVSSDWKVSGQLKPLFCMIFKYKNTFNTHWKWFFCDQFKNWIQSHLHLNTVKYYSICCIIDSIHFQPWTSWEYKSFCRLLSVIKDYILSLLFMNCFLVVFVIILLRFYPLITHKINVFIEIQNNKLFSHTKWKISVSTDFVCYYYLRKYIVFHKYRKKIDFNK